jgi:SAM-dependent methyltransferase
MATEPRPSSCPLDFFERVYLPYYTPVQAPARAVREADFICAQLGLASGARVLDLGCGHGRISLELARRGLAVTGVDWSAASLERARAAAGADGLAVRWILTDMASLPPGEEFDAVLNWLTAFGMRDSDAEDQQVLEGVRRVLRRGGQLLLDTVNHAWLLRHFQPRAYLALPGGGELREDRHFDLRTGRNYVRVTVTAPDGTCREGDSFFRVYTLTELARLLGAAGLHVTGTWGEIDGSPYGLDTRRLIVRAERPLVDERPARPPTAGGTPQDRS